jgi:hypothetical protein
MKPADRFGELVERIRAELQTIEGREALEEIEAEIRRLGINRASVGETPISCAWCGHPFYRGASRARKYCGASCSRAGNKHGAYVEIAQDRRAERKAKGKA